MRKMLAGCAIALMLAAVSPASADDVKSGLQSGDAPPAFVVTDVTGPAKGTELCYRCRYGGAPVVSIFAREIDDNVANLIKQVDHQIEQNSDKKLKAFVVLLTDDPKAGQKQLKELAEKNKIKNVPLTTFENAQGPENYKLADAADVTVMMWVESNVKVNHAFEPGKLDKKAVDSVVNDTGKILN